MVHVLYIRWLRDEILSVWRGNLMETELSRWTLPWLFYCRLRLARASSCSLAEGICWWQGPSSSCPGKPAQKADMGWCLSRDFRNWCAFPLSKFSLALHVSFYISTLTLGNSPRIPVKFSSNIRLHSSSCTSAQLSLPPTRYMWPDSSCLSQTLTWIKISNKCPDCDKSGEFY